MKVRVMSRMEAVQHSYLQDIPNCMIVSISCPGDSAPSFYIHPDRSKQRIKGVLKLNFNDIDKDYYNAKAPVLGDFAGLKAFVETAKQAEDVEEIIVHCAAGISRSAATAAAICQYLGLDEQEIIWSKYRYKPNMLVYKLALKALGIAVCEETSLLLQKINEEAWDNIDIPCDLNDLFK